jgi:toxin ParE1/3/4
MKQVRFEPEALDELDAAYVYYESLSPGLGDALRAEVKAKLQVMSEFPFAYPEWEGPARRVTLRRFPYSVFYRVYKDEIRIVAVLYARLDPGHMLRRIFG